MKKITQVVDFVKDSFNELWNKVSWPKYSELQKHTTLVLVASFIFALVIGAMDTVYRTVLGWFYTSF